MSAQTLRRYTDVSALLPMLYKSKISLLDPRSWDDTNDTHYLNAYQKKKGLAALLVLCFTQERRETYSHWRVFAPGPGGACITFKRTELLAAMTGTAAIRAENVIYRKLAQSKSKPPKTDELPFLKRAGFKDDKEFRVIYESPGSSHSVLDIGIPISCIARITLNPRMRYRLYLGVSEILKSFRGCDGLQVRRSTLVGNREWKRAGDAAS